MTPQTPPVDVAKGILGFTPVDEPTSQVCVTTRSNNHYAMGRLYAVVDFIQLMMTEWFFFIALKILLLVIVLSFLIILNG